MFRYVPRVIPTKIFVIGCGGTGSRLVPLLAQFIKTVTAGENPRGTVVDPVIYLIDDDTIESKNLVRQNFIQADVGKNKAEVLAQRYGRAYGVNIIPIVKRVMPESGRRNRLFADLDMPPDRPGENSLVIMCVDSAGARRDILSAWSLDGMRGGDISEIAPVFIDAGNEDDFGQVRIFQRAYINMDATERKEREKRLPLMRPEIYDIHCLPMDIKFYETLQDNPGGSCADLDQTLAINALMATMIMGMVQNLYYLKPFTYNSMSISLSGGVSVQHLTAEYLLSLSDSWRNLFGRVYLAFNARDKIDEYISVNVNRLRQMGLRKDGKPRKSSAKAATAVMEEVVAATDVVEDDEDPFEFLDFMDGLETEEAEESQESVTVVETPTTVAQEAPTATATVTAPPPLRPGLAVSQTLRPEI